jgi:hypothetical protein
MRTRTRPSFCALLAGAAITINPLNAQAGGMSRAGSYHAGPVTAGPNCHPGQPSGGGTTISKPVSVITKINVYKPVTINTNVNISKTVDESKNISIDKSLSITKNIDNSKNININTNIDNSKNIDDSKNITINKSIVINKGSSEADAAALAAAIAQSSASASVNISGGAFAGASVNAGGTTFVGGSSYAETPSINIVGDLGTIAVEVPAPVVAPRQCVEQDVTVIKAIHASCVSADHHEFPASHMVADTWIEASYEGEVARCIPGSHLKVNIGQVVQSSQGLASGQSSGLILECADHEALRHYKDGMLKCAPAVKVPDCTERTNLRKYGTNDMFFTYRTRACLETSGIPPQTSAIGGMSRDEDAHRSDLYRQEFAN